MEAYTVRDLRERTGDLIRGAEAGELAVVTKHGTPVFVAVPFDDALLDGGVRRALAVKLFDTDVLTLRQAAKLAGEPLSTFTERCSAQGVAVVRYPADELADEVAHLEQIEPPAGR
ncbi:MAG: type II toxin-antitoxin system prevent-host-death family antitoxin [Burkholderiales bacterium]|jgi:prevent-host-death family protein|nr:type II toxin-antitoxin system prevent-host-death family antitoxin [Burkholderiales bacterium]MBP7522880.1 type II toxin-antitoxin system prevent-host-death family antitoxin [Leptothrix sp. (in: b-proteobacteria)]